MPQFQLDRGKFFWKRELLSLKKIAFVSFKIWREAKQKAIGAIRFLNFRENVYNSLTTLIQLRGDVGLVGFFIAGENCEGNVLF